MSDLFGHAPSPEIDIDEGEYLLAHHDTAPSGLAILVSETGDRAKTFWLPVSKIKFSDTGRHVSMRIGAEKFSVIKAHIPEWLAKEKGLI
jgi:hypothetical protein